MTILVIAEHSDAQLKSSTLNTLKAAFELGSEVDVLVAGQNCEGAVKQAASVTGVHKVLVAEGEAFNHCLPEALTDAVLAAQQAGSYSRPKRAVVENRLRTFLSCTIERRRQL